MEKKKDQQYNIGFLVFGAILVGLGILFLVTNIIPILSIEKLWPLFLLIPVAILVAVWLQARERAAGVVLPIVLLTFYCSYFLWLNFTTWYNVETTWPNFIIGPGLGFLGLFIVTRNWAYLIPSSILLLLAAVFYAALIENTIFVGILLIVLGLVFILKPMFKEKTAETGE
ncbi:MAG: hypothetical protein KAT34_09520 [Candidatus Aminicenantes bacterium]|nr:hypothetical protein [Candidatus Aminicenantes bacterium]